MKYIAIKDFANVPPPGRKLDVDNIDLTGQGFTGLDGKPLTLVKQAHREVAGEGPDGEPLGTWHIHKGAIVEIGDPKAKNAKELAAADREAAAKLIYSKSIVEATPDSVKRVWTEVAADEKRAKADAARDAANNPWTKLQDVLERIASALEGGAIAAPAK